MILRKASLDFIFFISSILFASNSFSADEENLKDNFEIQLIRHATIKISMSGTTFLVDPMFSAIGDLPAFTGTYNQDLKNPLVDLPFSTKQILENVEAVVVTHTHMDHWDKDAQKKIPKKIPVFVQDNTDAKIIRKQGFKDVRVVTENTFFKGVKLIKVAGQHGTDLLYADPARVKLLGSVMGLIFSAPNKKNIYLAGDTVWRPDVDHALKKFQPDVIILNTGGAILDGFKEHPITMGKQDILQAYKLVANALIIAVHLDATNHTSFDRKNLRDFLKKYRIEDKVLIPVDGELIIFK